MRRATALQTTSLALSPNPWPVHLQPLYTSPSAAGPLRSRLHRLHSLQLTTQTDTIPHGPNLLQRHITHHTLATDTSHLTPHTLFTKNVTHHASSTSHLTPCPHCRPAPLEAAAPCAAPQTGGSSTHGSCGCPGPKPCTTHNMHGGDWH